MLTSGPVGNCLSTSRAYGHIRASYKVFMMWRQRHSGWLHMREGTSPGTSTQQNEGLYLRYQENSSHIPSFDGFSSQTATALDLS